MKQKGLTPQQKKAKKRELEKQFNNKYNSLKSSILYHKDSDAPEVKEILEVIDEHLPTDCSIKQKIKFAKEIKKICENLGTDNLKEIRNELLNYFNQSETKGKKSDKNTLDMDGLLKNVVKALSSPGKLLSLGTLINSFIKKGAASSTDSITIKSGIPVNGTDLCRNFLNMGCTQGYLENATNPDEQYIAQFSRLISNVNSVLPTLDGYFYQLKDCLTIPKLGAVIIKHLENSTDPNDQNLMVTSAAWMNHQVTFNASTSDAFSFESPALQSDVLNTVRSCQNYWKGTLKGFEIGLIVLGGIVGLGILGLTVFCCVEKCKESYNNRHRHANTQAPAGRNREEQPRDNPAIP